MDSFLWTSRRLNWLRRLPGWKVIHQPPPRIRTHMGYTDRGDRLAVSSQNAAWNSFRWLNLSEDLAKTPPDHVCRHSPTGVVRRFVSGSAAVSSFSVTLLVSAASVFDAGGWVWGWDTTSPGFPPNRSFCAFGPCLNGELQWVPFWVWVFDLIPWSFHATFDLISSSCLLT